ncbi:putative RNA-binding Zn ribbon-like protein [Streptomyces phaeochromogenes]|jgi:hypothetical protein|uniref:hypothetical protein n=1 Tax=Streptomyces TaxID=1883 RepID=UPI00118041BF|nr:MULTISPECIES: hypothetical protein [Streptomyces]MDQ0948953.1 putative RNA-binding Zn ribbon-like protein [Streptomyces phaeochromogenes]TRO63115.1 hypothetical protein E4K73_20110 [Streptomyces sp. IB201691-2A2]
MNDRVTQPLIATPDGEAELSLVVRLSWEDVAALGQEAGRLSASMQRPVTLDEAVSHRLRSRQAGSHARPQQAPPMPPSAVSAPAVSTVSSLPRSPGEQARQAIEKINGNGSAQGA